MRRLLLLLLPLALLCACTAAPAEQADAPFSFYYRCAEVACRLAKHLHEAEMMN